MAWHIRKGYKLKRWLKEKGIDPGKGPNKYRAVSTVYNDHKYDSKREADFAMLLDWRLRAGEIKSWEPHVTVEIFVNGFKICNYKVDFLVTHLDGLKEYVEVKGKCLYDAYAFTLKRKLFEATFIHETPDVKYTIEL